MAINKKLVPMYGTSNKAIELGQLATADTVDWSQVTNVPPIGTGSVTSIDMTVPTGFVVTGVPVTTAGVIAVGYGAGYQGYTSTEATKLSGIAAGATAGADWNTTLSNIPANITSWAGIAPSSKANDSSVVHIAGSESISGQKTFSMPIVSSTGTSSWILSNTGTGGLRKNSDSSISFVGNPGTTSDNLAINTNRSLTYNGNQVWHAGTFNPASKANKAGDNFTGRVSVNVSNTPQFTAGTWSALSGGGNGNALLGNNATYWNGDSSYRYVNSHASLGASGIVLSGFGEAGPWFFDMGDIAATANAAFTPTLRRMWHEGNLAQPATLNTTQTFTADKTFSGNLYTVGVSNLRTADSSAWVRQPRIFVQATDPGAAAADGDLWFW